ncbi:MAG: bifunctional diaminohydroxyphosphoribosylaminopyrimidine deaminase/5-amino-6-(5-phosphoribosylamino)uracil reductase RibD [Phaeodactylibacter sp.]|uniref:bifunctional diaminohydroxyphosphoribosylaminopyrimidine deaminase/5-amino-6-(5-phosphoribosylamino)uracil reductase RibD n=1 Tax=Phaeodactylibacter sp. TaxID=1940289 RepID=UPI0032ED26DA
MDNYDEHFMQRCFDLARLGAGKTAPNPMVGAVIVHQGRIIGEGYHQAYREAHAEVNAVRSIAAEDRHLLKSSTLYVSLEPCNIHRNTPPCTLLILQEGIPRVVVSDVDQTPGVNGSGLDRLRKAGVDVTVGVLKAQGKRLSLARNTFVTGHRPYILLKYAQSANGIFAPEDNRQLWLTHAYSKRLVHKWRSESSAILVGANTALADDPQLTNRLYYGPSPVRVLLDLKGNLPPGLKVFSDGAPTLLFRAPHLPGMSGLPASVRCFPIPEGAAPVRYLLSQLYRLQLSTLMVEGGIHTLRQFINEGLWDEALVLTSGQYQPSGRQAPALPLPPVQSDTLGSDRIDWFYRTPIR